MDLKAKAFSKLLKKPSQINHKRVVGFSTLTKVKDCCHSILRFQNTHKAPLVALETRRRSFEQKDRVFEGQQLRGVPVQVRGAFKHEIYKGMNGSRTRL